MTCKTPSSRTLCWILYLIWAVQVILDESLTIVAMNRGGWYEQNPWALVFGMQPYSFILHGLMLLELGFLLTWLVQARQKPLEQAGLLYFYGILHLVWLLENLRSISFLWPS